ncbi:MAG: ATP-binding protein [Candidatus Hodarchaeales archaeon]
MPEEIFQPDSQNKADPILCDWCKDSPCDHLCVSCNARICKDCGRTVLGDQWYCFACYIVDKTEFVELAHIIRSLMLQRRTEDALRESEKRYRSLVENMPIGVYRTTPGPKGTFLMVNPALLRILGFESEESLKKTRVADVYGNPLERKVFSDNLSAQGSVKGIELHLKKKNGTPIWCSVTAKTVHGKNGQVAYYDCILEDITERRQVEQQLRRQKTELSEFAHTMSHDLQNHLVAIRGFADLFQSKLEPSYGEKIVQLVDTMKELLQRSVILADAGLIVEPASEIDLTKLVRGVARTTIPESIIFEQDDLPTVVGDKEKLKQIFQNLFENAVTHGEPAKITVHRRDLDKSVILLITNDGEPIPPKHRPNIFDRGFTTKKGGTGLGLPIIQKLVEASGWTISLEDVQETTFRIDIPLLKSL